MTDSLFTYLSSHILSYSYSTVLFSILIKSWPVQSLQKLVCYLVLILKNVNWLTEMKIMDFNLRMTGGHPFSPPLCVLFLYFYVCFVLIYIPFIVCLFLHAYWSSFTCFSVCFSVCFCVFSVCFSVCFSHLCFSVCLSVCFFSVLLCLLCLD